MAMKTNAEVMAGTMAARGAEYVFGLPGGEMQTFGIAARRANTVEEVRDCVERALSLRIPFLIEAPVDNREYRELIRCAQLPGRGGNIGPRKLRRKAAEVWTVSVAHMMGQAIGTA